jgi:hypothetical protein
MYHLFLGPLTLWTRETRSSDYRDTLEHHFYPPSKGKWQGRRVGMLTGHDHALTARGDADHGWSGCSATGPGQS